MRMSLGISERSDRILESRSATNISGGGVVGAKRATQKAAAGRVAIAFETEEILVKRSLFPIHFLPILPRPTLPSGLVPCAVPCERTISFRSAERLPNESSIGGRENGVYRESGKRRGNQPECGESGSGRVRSTRAITIPGRVARSGFCRHDVALDSIFLRQPYLVVQRLGRARNRAAGFRGHRELHKIALAMLVPAAR
jgi:hypothetical protein